MKSKKGIIILSVLIFIFLLPTSFAAEYEFLYKLQRNLQAYGWSEEEISAFMNAAEHLNWDLIENDYNDVVAYSLQYCKKTKQKTTAAEKAELAYELSAAVSDMKKIGFDDDTIVRVAVNTSREFVKALYQYRKHETEDGLGDMIRKRIREQVCREGTDTQKAKYSERIRNRAKINNQQIGKQFHGTGHGYPF